MHAIGVLKEKKKTMKQLIFKSMNFSKVKKDWNLPSERAHHVPGKVDLE